jgi:hypothetical protein
MVCELLTCRTRSSGALLADHGNLSWWYFCSPLIVFQQWRAYSLLALRKERNHAIAMTRAAQRGAAQQ